MHLRSVRWTTAAAALAATAVLAPASVAQTQTGAALERRFADPPGSAKPHTWWHWMHGMVTKVGITRDLEAMREVGLGGAQMFHVSNGIPPGPVGYMTPQWREMVKHAVTEADRLGLELCIHNCAGWSSSGGPWIEPELSMQVVVTSEHRVSGPAQFVDVLRQPPSRRDFYRDIAVLAFPTPQGEAVRVADLSPKITASAPGFDGSKIVDGNPGTYTMLPRATRDKPQHFQLEFARPYRASALTLVPGPGRNTNGGTLQISDDGAKFRTISGFTIPTLRHRPLPLTISFGPLEARFYRVVFTRTDVKARRMTFSEVELDAGFRIDNWQSKAGFAGRGRLAPDTRQADPSMAIRLESVVNITSKMDATGHLTWHVPQGQWTILRVGHTTTGKENHPAPDEGRGLECDKLSSRAADAHWAGMMAKVIQDVGPLAGKTLNNVLIDSYEVGYQNWTPLMREEFRKRRGYDMLPYLPAMTGRVVGSLDASERFLWDLRRTIADLFAENYFGRFADLCHQHGMMLSVEPYGNGNFDNLTAGSHADIPMSEFWVGSNSNAGSKQAASIAHTYGRKFVGAESFTAMPERGGWRVHPYAIKGLGDLIYCGGVNRFIFHRYAHQPWVDRQPGMTMGRFGFHFERTITWWKQAPAWTRYLARCQYLLQEGLFVGDLCYFYGEDAPQGLPGRRSLRPAPPNGYDYDGCNADVVLNRMSVKDCRVVLADGMSYRVLVLPDSDAMRPAVLRKIRDLVRAGATVIGPRPTRSPSMEGWPGCDREVQAIAAEVWADCDGKAVTEHAFGQGKVIWGRPLEEVFAAMNLAPDFEAAPETARIEYIHRRIDDTDIYFVSNQRQRFDAVDCTFRVAGKAPELWHPDTGRIESAAIFEQKGGRTTVSLCFDPHGSMFVVFRQPLGPMDSIASAEREGKSILHAEPPRAGKLEVLKATYGVFEVATPDMVDVTAQLRALVRDGALSVRASNAIAGDPASGVVKELQVEYTYNGQKLTKTVGEGQMLRIPDKPAGEQALVIRKAWYGLIPPEPDKAAESLTVDVTAQLRARIKDGRLSVVADNTLAGDPTPMVVKQLRVAYRLDGVAQSRTIAENQRLEIPDSAVSEFPAADLAVAADGRLELRAWEAGAYELKSASGKTLRVDVQSVPAALDVSGPWRLRFPSGWGAPDAVVLHKLISWTDHSHPGVKHFSGTATYAKRVDIRAAMLGADKQLWLDLGQVKNIAEVSVNGKDLGVLWKPPFRVEITGLVKPGANELEVRVTNNWPNRLIGDAGRPDGLEWVGERVKAWPQWVLDGKPVPQTGRYTWTTWRHHSAGSELFASGLLGPVQLRSAARRIVER